MLLFLFIASWAFCSFGADFSGPEYAFMFHQAPAKSQVKSLQSLARKKVVNLLRSHELQPSTYGEQVYNMSNPLIHQLVASKLLKKYKPYILAKSITPGALLLPNNPEIVEHALLDQIIFDDSNTLVAHIHNAFANRLASIRVWDIPEQKEIAHVQHYPHRITALCFNPTSNQFAIGDAQGEITSFNLQGQQILQLHGNRSAIWKLSYSPDSSKLISYASGSNDGAFRISSVHNGKCIHLTPSSMLSYEQMKWVYSHADQRKFHTFIVQNAIKLYKDSEYFHKIVCTNQPQQVSWNKSGNILGVAFDNGSVQLYDCPSYQKAIESIDIRQAFSILHTLTSLHKECDAPLHLVRPLGSSHNQLSLYNVPHSFRSVIQQHRFKQQNMKMNQYLRNTLSCICLLLSMGILALWAPHLQDQNTDPLEAGVLAAKSAAFTIAIVAVLQVAEEFSIRRLSLN